MAMDKMIDTAAENLIEVQHVQENGHHTLRATTVHIAEQMIELIETITIVVEHKEDPTEEITDAEWYALLSKAEEMSDSISWQTRALINLNDALTLRA